MWLQDNAIQKPSIYKKKNQNTEQSDNRNVLL